LPGFYFTKKNNFHEGTSKMIAGLEQSAPNEAIAGNPWF